MSLELHFDLFLHRVGSLAHFEAYKLQQLLKGRFMDPITAIFNFLATPAGQTIVNDLVALDKAFLTLISGLVQKIHDKV